MHVRARPDAHDAGQVLVYALAVDRPATLLGKAELSEMRAQPNVSATSKMLGVLPIFVGMAMRLTDTALPSLYAPGAHWGIVVADPRPREPPLAGRESIVSDGCAVLQ